MPSEPGYDTPTAAELANDAAFAALYETSFPAEEQEPIDIIMGSIGSGAGLVLRARLDALTVGFATAHLVRDPPLAFLVYLAVSTEMRRHRIGSTLFERLWQTCVERGRARGCPPRAFVWEIDAPHLATDESQRSRRRARLEFFRRLGGEVWLETYLQPPVRGITPVAMLLMGRPAGHTERPPLEQIVRGIYFEKYGGANGIDRPVLERLVAPSLGRTV